MIAEFARGFISVLGTKYGFFKLSPTDVNWLVLVVVAHPQRKVKKTTNEVINRFCIKC
jgi:hypothetical protein